MAQTDISFLAFEFPMILLVHIDYCSCMTATVNLLSIEIIIILLSLYTRYFASQLSQNCKSMMVHWKVL